MKTVYKYPVPLCDEFDLILPEGAVALKVGLQNNKPQIWFLVDPSANFACRHFLVRGTGHEISADRIAYVDSFMFADEELVFHLFEVL